MSLHEAPVGKWDIFAKIAFKELFHLSFERGGHSFNADFNNTILNTKSE